MSLSLALLASVSGTQPWCRRTRSGSAHAGCRWPPWWRRRSGPWGSSASSTSQDSSHRGLTFKSKVWTTLTVNAFHRCGYGTVYCTVFCMFSWKWKRTYVRKRWFSSYLTYVIICYVLYVRSLTFTSSATSTLRLPLYILSAVSAYQKAYGTGKNVMLLQSVLMYCVKFKWSVIGTIELWSCSFRIL